MQLSNEDQMAVFDLLPKLVDAILSLCYLGELRKDELLRLFSRTPYIPESAVLTSYQCASARLTTISDDI